MTEEKKKKKVDSNSSSKKNKETSSKGTKKGLDKQSVDKINKESLTKKSNNKSDSTSSVKKVSKSKKVNFGNDIVKEPEIKKGNNKIIKISKIKKDESNILSNKKKKDVSKAVKLYKKKKLKKQKVKQKVSGKFNLDILDLLLIVVGTALVSCLFTGFILNYQYKKNLHLVNGDVVSDKNVQEFLNTYSEILDNYYEEVDEEAMMRAAMEGMLSFLQDNYSIYLTENDSDSLSEMLDGSYEGLGIVIRGNVIDSIYKNSPAEKVGLQVGDTIIGINDKEVNMDNFNEISEFIKSDEENDIKVKRENEEISFKVKPSTVNIPSTTSNIIKSPNKKKNIGYISLNAFSSLSFEDFQESLMEIEEKGIDSLIIDLRNNTGGYLNVATNIASLFLEKGEVIYSLENKNKITTYKDETNDKREYKIVVLVNANTASAAEILATALHDSYGATIVGKTTFGKGKVQTMKYYEDSIVKYTSAKWLRPNGECIDEVGIVPDYDVSVTINGNEVFDTQLDKAIELLSK